MLSLSKHQAMALGGVELIPDLTGALYVPDYRTLLVADLHFEKGSSRAAQGVHLPPYDTRSTLKLLRLVVARLGPERLISLGDSFHDSGGLERLDTEDREDLWRLASETEIVWIAGNHDRRLKGKLPGATATEVSLGPLTLRHEPGGDGIEIAGHLHPVGAVIKRGRKLRCKCYVGDGGRLVMPAFGAYTGGLSVMTDAFAALFPKNAFHAWLIGRTAIHPFPSSKLCP